MASPTVELLDLSSSGCRLVVTAAPHRGSARRVDPWFDTAIRVEAHPFAGTVDTILTLSDFETWAQALRRVGELPGRVVLGGNRSAELVIDIERQVGRPPGLVALQISVTPSGDDPSPLLRFLMSDAEPSWLTTAGRIAGLRQPPGATWRPTEIRRS